ncbi:MAG TPA: hypothetical protein VH370_15040 [Humisphaera sp.]|jgi:hypothetical protein|nr:hypothetical protein [Humisphaera sp.]
MRQLFLYDSIDMANPSQRHGVYFGAARYTGAAEHRACATAPGLSDKPGLPSSSARFLRMRATVLKVARGKTILTLLDGVIRLELTAATARLAAPSAAWEKMR